MKKAQSTAVLLLSLIFFSCETATDSGGPGGGGPTMLTAAPASVELAVGFSSSVSISGGSGGYYIKSVSDSTIVWAQSQWSFYQPYILLMGMKVGTATVLVEDSAKTATVLITVTVKTMISNPKEIKTRTGRSGVFYVYGGSSPYSIHQPSSAGIASVTQSRAGSNGFEYTANTIGSTSVTIKDNSTPPNTVTIPITVSAVPLFTVPGSVSFNSSQGNFETSGIVPNGILGLLMSLSNDAGAGGVYLTSTFTTEKLMLILGYKKRPDGLYDAIAFGVELTTYGARTVAFDTNYQTISSLNRAQGSVIFGVNPSLNTSNGSLYRLHAGSVVFTNMTATAASGTFSGTGALSVNGVPFPGQTISVTNGVFSVPMIEDEFYLGSAMDANSEKSGIHRLLQNMAKELKERMIQQQR